MIYDLSSDAVCRSYHTASNDMIMSKQANWKGCGVQQWWPTLKYCHDHNSHPLDFKFRSSKQIGVLTIKDMRFSWRC